MVLNANKTSAKTDIDILLFCISKLYFGLVILKLNAIVSYKLFFLNVWAVGHAEFYKKKYSLYENIYYVN
ncbi:hypothetical protein EG347_01750 [Chryseobacterium sp. G0186]|nr:hypothetical protein EG347_01750 [Chryseobacterium sp. G0186]